MDKIEVKGTEYTVKENENVDGIESICITNTETGRVEVFHKENNQVYINRDRREGVFPDEMEEVLKNIDNIQIKY
jgi:hypothetical protein